MYASNRKGIVAGGNLIMDYVKIISEWPQEGMLTNIESEEKNPGGAPHNVLVNIAKFNADLPLYAVGLCGNDEAGQEIINAFNHNGIDTSYIKTVPSESTSYTEVISVKTTGSRTFFHYRGVNKLLGPEHFSDIGTNAKIFHLGYLLLLDKLDGFDAEFTVCAARLLKEMRAKGYKISVDLVSEKKSSRYQHIVIPCIKYIDYLIINEVEANNLTDIGVRDIANNNIDKISLLKIANRLFAIGVNDLVIIHFPEGAFYMEKNGNSRYIPSYPILTSAIKSSVGAGDAFCSGVLYGIHECFPIEKSIKIGHASANFNLQSATSTGGAVSLNKLMRKFSL